MPDSWYRGHRRGRVHHSYLEGWIRDASREKSRMMVTISAGSTALDGSRNRSASLRLVETYEHHVALMSFTLLSQRNRCFMVKS